MHTDLTLNIMDDLTSSLGCQLRKFCSDTCKAFNTRELPKEANTRLRRQATQIQSQRQVISDHNVLNPHTAPSQELPVDPETTGLPRALDSRPPQPPLKVSSDTQAASRPCISTARRPKVLNLSTYKVHALGDYVNTIRTFGTTDSYSTQTVCPYLTPT